MNQLKQLAQSANAKRAALGVSVAAAASPVFAAEIWESAVTALSGLLVGVAAVGASTLAIAVSAVGFRVVKRLVNGA